MRSKAARCFLFAVAITAAAAPSGGSNQPRPSSQAGKRETLTAEQKQRLAVKFKHMLEQREVQQKQARARLEASNQQFLASERKKLAAENAAARSAIAARRLDARASRFEAIGREARELSQRAASATAAERAAIDRRANELLAEIRGGSARR